MSSNLKERTVWSLSVCQLPGTHEFFLLTAGNDAVDGEAMQVTRLSVELLPKMARTLSLYGTWAQSTFGKAEAAAVTTRP